MPDVNDDGKNIIVNLSNIPSAPHGNNPHHTVIVPPHKVQVQVKHPPVQTIKPVFGINKLESVDDEKQPEPKKVPGKLKVGSTHLANLEKLFGKKP
jgi:hypothetical protein